MAVDRVTNLKLVKHNEHVTREKLAKLLGCTHLNGERPCRACAGGLH